jgi:hypothetical protein
MFRSLVTALFTATALATVTVAQDPVGLPAPTPEAIEGVFKSQKHYSPYAGRNFPTQVYWGDTHLHTAMSMDAGAFGNRLGLEEAYRFARGEEVTSATGLRVKLSRPLDFLVVADHSDNMGFFPDLFAGDPQLLADPTGKRWYEMIREGGARAVEPAMEIIDMASRGTFPQSLYYAPGTAPYQGAWEATIRAAEQFNDPGRFTAFIGYEWTSLAPPGNNLHRVVVYRDGGDKAVQTVPFTMLPPTGSVHPEDLWKVLHAYEDKTGGRVLAIPHNGNLSNGMMFPLINPVTGEALTREYAETRIRWEPLYEATQIKGDGEAHPLLSPDDEFADYETWDFGNLNFSEPKTPDMLPYEYARTALQLGLKVEQRVGVNPYKFGMIGSTDSHTSLATAEEENFFGKHSGSEPDPMRWEHPVLSSGDVTVMGWQQVSSGYAAVWATENTREAIWDAMKRREVYATTGSRMLVRFFGGWEFEAADALNRLPAHVGYTKGVPMGADLPPRPGNASPTFLVAALKDPLSGNLDRIQVVKGWGDARGERHEKVYDVVWSGDRQVGRDGKLPQVGNTVDVANATWSNTIGDPEFITVWTDPDFDPGLRAVYYARVLEIPTPRWTAYEAKRFGIELPDEVPMWTQERAYTSPIWYTPTR